MRHKNLGVALTTVSLYVLGAAVLFGWLAMRASNGGIFTGSAPTFSVVVPSAPAIEARKTPVLSDSGVPIGVVSHVEPTDEGVFIEFKVTGNVEVGRDATAQVIVQNIIGEKVVMLNAGDAASPAEDRTEIAYGGDGSSVEPDAALEPALEAIRTLQDPVMQQFINDQLVLGESVAADGAAMVQATTKILRDLALQSESLGNLGRRMGALLSDVTTRDDEIGALVDNAALLTEEIEALLAGQMGLITDGLVLTNNLAAMITRRRDEITTLLDRLPFIVSLGENTTEELRRIFDNEKGAYINVAALEMPALPEMLRILEEGR